ncbi:hypothetical protein JOE11_003455 [Robbsia andropogonis]
MLLVNSGPRTGSVALLRALLHQLACLIALAKLYPNAAFNSYKITKIEYSHAYWRPLQRWNLATTPHLRTPSPQE